MTKPDKRPVTLEELLVTSLAQTDALAKLLIEKGLIKTRVHAEDFRGTDDVSRLQRISNRVSSNLTRQVEGNETRDAVRPVKHSSVI